jgi:retron-type reverse transcriptase
MSTKVDPLLANIVLDPLDKELTRRGHVFARYADDFLILVKSAKAARRVMESVAAYVEGKLMPMRSHPADRPAGRINNGNDPAREGETC